MSISFSKRRFRRCDLLGDDPVTFKNDHQGKVMIENSWQQKGVSTYEAIEIAFNHGVSPLSEPEFNERLA